MTLWEYLDKRAERNATRPMDARVIVGALFLFGYFALLTVLCFVAVPAANSELVNDALLVLGPAVGVIVGAMFRSDRRDEQATENTREAFRAMRATAESRNPPHQENPT